ncbi:MAG: hypothetical protein ACUVQM_03105 [Candidatus Hadarchaeaceae archaeon]
MKAREEKIEKYKPQLAALAGEISKVSGAILTTLKEIGKSEPEGDIHHGLMKTATEARRLFYEKISRGLASVDCPQEFTADSMPRFSERISKATNIIADAMKSHGRYVRAVYVKKYSEFEFHLRKLHELTSQTQSILAKIIGEIKAIDGLTSEISNYKQICENLEKTRKNISSLQDVVKKIENDTNEKMSQLTMLKKSPEFKRAKESIEELEKSKCEINNILETAKGLISEFNRPFRKLEKMLNEGRFQMEPEIQQVLKMCINEPSEVISSEENLNNFENLIQKTVEIAKSKKINLDKREIKNLESAANSLPLRLRGIKSNLTRLSENIEIKKMESEMPVLEQAVMLENLIKSLEQERAKSLDHINELERETKLMLDALAPIKNNLQKLAAEVLGTNVKIAS